MTTTATTEVATYEHRFGICQLCGARRNPGMFALHIAHHDELEDDDAGLFELRTSTYSQPAAFPPVHPADRRIR